MFTFTSEGWLRMEGAVRLLKPLSLDAPTDSGLGNWVAASSVRAEGGFAGGDFTTMRVTSRFLVAGSEFTSIRSTGELPAAAGLVADATAIFEVPGVFSSARFVEPAAGVDSGTAIGAAVGGVTDCGGG
jgi:hypothetical protein